MSAEPAPKRPPSIYVSDTVDVEIRVSPRQLEREGWVYVGKPDKDGKTAPLPPRQAHVVEVVRRWHDETHTGPWRWCTLSPCTEVHHLPAEDDE